MQKSGDKLNFMIYGIGALCLSLHAWNQLIVQAAALRLIQFLNRIIDWQLWHDLTSALPHSLNQSAIYSGTYEAVAAILMIACAYSLLKLFSYDFQISNSRLERLRLSSIFSFCYLFALMSVSYLCLVAHVLLEGKAIKPFPKESIGALQYLDALSFLPWAILCALLLFAFSEASLQIGKSRRHSPSHKTPSNSDEESSHFMAAA